MFLLFHEKIYVSDVDPCKVEVCLTFIIRKRKNSKKFAVLKRNGKKKLKIEKSTSMSNVFHPFFALSKHV